jgi:hypothetical protein
MYKCIERCLFKVVYAELYRVEISDLLQLLIINISKNLIS